MPRDPSRSFAKDEAWVARVEDAAGVVFHEITQEPSSTVEQQARKRWAKLHVQENKLREFARSIAQTAAMHPDIVAKHDATPVGRPTDTEIEASVRNIITLVGSPGSA